MLTTASLALAAAGMAVGAMAAKAQKPGGVQLWKDGPYWAECNVGAKQPEESGHYFWWGDATGYKRNASNDGWISAMDGTPYAFTDCPTHGKGIPALRALGYLNARNTLAATHDAATVALGAPWRLPTDGEFKMLILKCDLVWTNRNGVCGRLVTGRGAYAAKRIFLPAAGYGFGSSIKQCGSYGSYWSASPMEPDSTIHAWNIYFGSSYFSRYNYPSRYYGQTIRPVRNFK